MRIDFERLEQRDVLSHVGIEVSGPEMAYVGDEVNYSVRVTSHELNPFTAQASLILPLDDLQWTLDETPWPAPDEMITLAPEESRVFTATGRVPANLSYFQLHAAFILDHHGTSNTHTTVVLDPFVNSDTVGAAISWYRDDGLRVSGSGNASFHSAEPAGDLDGDGFNDVYLVFVNMHDYLVDGERKVDLQRIRHTLFGSDQPLASSIYLNPSEGELLETLEGLDEQPPLSQTPLPFRRAGSIFGGEFPVGDVDGDGFEDALRGEPQNLVSTGTATLLFGPDFRENFLIFGSSRAGQMNAEILFGMHAGSLGDINGDGIGDFYVMGGDVGGNKLYVLHGRAFDRDQAGDIDRDGTVDFDDFLVLSANFGRENAARADGDLDGDNLVAFSDFLILSSTFGRTMAPADAMA